MSPSPSMSAHWGKQMYASWRQTRQGGSVATGAVPGPLPLPVGSSSSSSSSSHMPEKRSMDSNRSSSSGSIPISRQVSNSGWFGSRK